MLFPLKIDLFLREIALLYTNFDYKFSSLWSKVEGHKCKGFATHYEKSSCPASPWMSDSLSDSEGDSLSVDEPSLESSELTRHSSGTNTILWRRRTKVVASGFFSHTTSAIQRSSSGKKWPPQHWDTENKNNIRLFYVPLPLVTWPS